MVNPATWSEELLVRLHREVLLLPDVKGTLAVACGQIDAMIIAGLPMGDEDPHVEGLDHLTRVGLRRRLGLLARREADVQRHDLPQFGVREFPG